MPPTQSPTQIQSASGGPAVAGIHARYTLEHRPVWHSEEGGWVLAGLDQTLSLTLRLPANLADPAAARKALMQIAAGPTLVVLPSLRFQGHILRCSFTEVANQSGNYVSAQIALTVQGNEV